jgi:hypothetical protein
VPDRRPPIISRKLLVAVLVSLGLVPGCGGAPAAPASTGPMLTGFVYEVMLSGAGEPPIADATITVTEPDGDSSSAKTDGAGFYSVQASTGTVVVTASKEGYKTRQSTFDVTDSTVLNFALRPSN